ncbi:MAG TPA: penicillin-binding transpeptidase domain-containing protein [Acidimicrobiales bacterium]|nr:penicillin-binding transpeptidase domain-containing protein [Acidimicrobiales bacterium]
MDRRVRIVAVLFIACFSLLFLQLNNLQVRKAGALQHSPYAPSTVVSTWNLPRGDIVSSTGSVLAYSTKNPSGAGYVRHYTNGPLYADVTGYYDWAQQALQFGVEDEYNSYLVQHESSVHSLSDLLTQTTGTDTVEITISPRLQAVAEAALAPYTDGAVVAIDPTSGAILAMYSKPSYDPNKLSSADGTAINKYYASLSPNSGASPLVNGATSTLTAPGSTFKVITTSAILDHDPSIATEYVKPTGALTLPQTNLKLHNFAGEVCGGVLASNLWLSCDTAYGHYGLQLGGRNLAAEANAFGLNSRPPIDLPPAEVSVSRFPSAASFAQNKPGLAYSAIGQENVAETVLQDALVVSAIANGGTIMAPHLMAHVFDGQGRIVATYRPHAWLHATSIATADQVRELMLGVAARGTAAGLFPPSLNVAAKTGTAEVGNNNCSSNWLVATGPAGAGEVPKVAVAAIVPYQPNIACDGTGATIAGPVVAKVLDAAVGYAG